jgi:hypothetical protein
VSEQVSLPCGATGFWDDCGVRCTECLAVWGSIGCDCSNELREQEKALRGVPTREDQK